MSLFDFLYQPIHTIIIPTIMTAVLSDESGENKQDTIIPVPAPVKKSTTDFSRFMIPITLSLSIDCTIFETFYAINSSNKYQSVEMKLENN